MRRPPVLADSRPDDRRRSGGDHDVGRMHGCRDERGFGAERGAEDRHAVAVPPQQIDLLDEQLDRHLVRRRPLPDTAEPADGPHPGAVSREQVSALGLDAPTRTGEQQHGRAARFVRVRVVEITGVERWHGPSVADVGGWGSGAILRLSRDAPPRSASAPQRGQATAEKSDAEPTDDDDFPGLVSSPHRGHPVADVQPDRQRDECSAGEDQSREQPTIPGPAPAGVTPARAEGCT